MKTTIMLNEAVITTEVKAEDIAKIEKFQPEALQQINADGVTTFQIACRDSGGIGSAAIFFDQVTEDGYAALQVMIPGESADERKTFVAEELGGIITKAAEIEAGLTAVLTRINEDLTKIKNSITVAL